MKAADYFDMRMREEEENLAAIVSGRIIRIVQMTPAGEQDVTEEHKTRLRKAIEDYRRAGSLVRAAEFS